ncbi:hypothetical protein ACI2JA_08110 [Alkalihalobacillus sp. NPDC078783]
MNKTHIQRYVFITILILFIATLFFAVGHAVGEQNEKRSDKESIVLGHSLFQLFMATTEINEVRHLEDEEQKLRIIHENLKQLSFSSTIINTLTNAEVLSPIATELSAIHEMLNSNFYKNGAISELDRERYERLFDEIQNLHDEFSTVYYEPNSEATLRKSVTDFGVLVEQKERLQNQ